MKNIIDERKKEILIAVVKEFIKSGKPVSSKRLIRVYGFDYSSATIRNIMSALEKTGYLTHPHTSAGRTPTVSGYRFYVDSMNNQAGLGLVQRRAIIDFFEEQNEIEVALENTCKLMAQITPYLALAVRFNYRKIVIKHIDLVALENHQLLIVVITKTGEVFKSRFKVSQFDFDICELENLLNKVFSGLDLASISKKCKRLRTLKLFGNLFSEITKKIENLIEEKQNIIFYDGVVNLLGFEDFDRSKEVLNLFHALDDNETEFRRLLSSIKDSCTFVAIGDEVKSLPTNKMSLVLTPYLLNKQIAGSVGIIGPMRMDYEKVIATSECVATNISIALQKMGYSNT